MPAPFVFDRTWTFPVGAAEVWDRLLRTDRYPQWWPWLRGFDLDGAGSEPLPAGARASCVVRGPLPYTLRFTVDVEEVVPAELVRTTVRGDLAGPARLELEEADGGCRARLAWSVELCPPTLRRLAVVARPAMVWAHDRVVAAGISSFRRATWDGR